MVEQRSYYPFVKERALVPPSEGLPTLEELDQIFGVDLRALTEEMFIERGVWERSQRLEFLNPPIRHEYKKKLPDGREITVVSQAIYFVETVVGNHALMASFMPEGSKATEHFHLSGIKEHYGLIAGSAHLRTGYGVIDLGEENRRHTVEENIIHQFATNSLPAFTALVMENAGRVPRDKWHILTQ